MKHTPTALLAAALIQTANTQEITIPESWKKITPNQTGGILAGGVSQDGKKGALLSKMDIPEEEIQNMNNPLGESALLIAEATKQQGYKILSEQTKKTSSGEIKILSAKQPKHKENLEIIIIPHQNSIYTLRLITKDQEETPKKDQELKQILKSLKIPNPKTQQTKP